MTKTTAAGLLALCFAPALAGACGSAGSTSDAFRSVEDVLLRRLPEARGKAARKASERLLASRHSDTLLRMATETPAEDRQARIGLLSGAARSFLAWGARERALALLDQVEAESHQLTSDEAMAAALAEVALLAAAAKDYGRAERIAAELQRRSEAVAGDAKLGPVVSEATAIALASAGQYEEARAVVDALPEARRQGSRLIAAWGLALHDLASARTELRTLMDARMAMGAEAQLIGAMIGFGRPQEAVELAKGLPAMEKPLLPTLWARRLAELGHASAARGVTELIAHRVERAKTLLALTELADNETTERWLDEVEPILRANALTWGGPTLDWLMATQVRVDRESAARTLALDALRGREKAHPSARARLAIQGAGALLALGDERAISELEECERAAGVLRDPKIHISERRRQSDTVGYCAAALSQSDRTARARALFDGVDKMRTGDWLGVLARRGDPELAVIASYLVEAPGPYEELARRGALAAALEIAALERKGSGISALSAVMAASERDVDGGDHVAGALMLHGGHDAPATKAGEGGVVWVAFPETWYDRKGRTHVGAFELNRTEVSAGQYQRCVEDEACTAPADVPDGFEFVRTYGRPDRADYPVANVTRPQAEAFCAWVGGRLPSPAEWHLAARSGGQPYVYPWGNAAATCEHATFAFGHNPRGGSLMAKIGCGREHLSPACAHPAGNSEQGLCDLVGNVAEWVSLTSARGRAHYMGGSIATVRPSIYDMTRDSPDEPSFYVGFRCAR